MYLCDCCEREEKDVYYKNIVSVDGKQADVFVCISCYVLLDKNQKLADKTVSKLSDRPFMSLC